MVAPTQNMITLPTHSRRERKKDGGTSGVALRVSTTRETASRAVNALERRGIIRRDGETLVVVAPHRLEELIL